MYLSVDDEVKSKSDNADRDGTISDVEERPVIATYMNTDEVHNKPVADAVDKVAQRSPDDHSFNDASEHTVAWQVTAESENDDDNDDGD